MWNLISETAHATVQAEIMPEAGARRIWRWSYDVVDSGDLRMFIGLASQLEDHPDERSRLTRNGSSKDQNLAGGILAVLIGLGCFMASYYVYLNRP